MLLTLSFSVMVKLSSSVNDDAMSDFVVMNFILLEAIFACRCYEEMKTNRSRKIAYKQVTRIILDNCTKIKGSVIIMLCS